MKTAIVTGANGFIGTHLCHELTRNNIDVTGLVRQNSSSKYRLGRDVNVVVCGMDDYDSFSCEGADTCYHLAWEGATGSGRDSEELQVRNVMRTVSALKMAKRNGCNRFVAMGTVFERLVPQILADSIHRRADFYLLSKQNAHYMCLKLAEKLDIEFVWATIFQPIGRYIKKEQVMAYTIESLLQCTPPRFGPAMQPYDVTPVEDIAYGLRLLGDCDLSRQEYYIGSGNPQIMKTYLSRIKEILQVDTELAIGALPDDGMRFFFDWYDIKPLQKDTGYVANTPFEKAVFDVADWIQYA